MAEGRLIISNTTPIINLAEIVRLDLLEGMFGKVVEPTASKCSVPTRRSSSPK